MIQTLFIESGGCQLQPLQFTLFVYPLLRCFVPRFDNTHLLYFPIMAMPFCTLLRASKKTKDIKIGLFRASYFQHCKFVYLTLSMVMEIFKLDSKCPSCLYIDISALRKDQYNTVENGKSDVFMKRLSAINDIKSRSRDWDHLMSSFHLSWKYKCMMKTHFAWKMEIQTNDIFGMMRYSYLKCYRHECKKESDILPRYLFHIYNMGRCAYNVTIRSHGMGTKVADDIHLYGALLLLSHFVSKTKYYTPFGSYEFSAAYHTRQHISWLHAYLLCRRQGYYLFVVNSRLELRILQFISHFKQIFVVQSGEAWFIGPQIIFQSKYVFIGLYKGEVSA